VCRCSSVYLLLFDSISFKIRPTFTAQCSGCVMYMYFCIVFVYIFFILQENGGNICIHKICSRDGYLFPLLRPVPTYNRKHSSPSDFHILLLPIFSAKLIHSMFLNIKLKKQQTYVNSRIFGDLEGSQNCSLLQFITFLNSKRVGKNSRLLFKNVNIRIFIIIPLSVVLYGYETWYQTLRKKHRLRMRTGCWVYMDLRKLK
jgi:hypothetical protein